MRLLAPAKVTWNLEITGRRDDGYHLLRSEMMSVDLYDLMEISEGEGLEILSTSHASTQAMSIGDDNLISRALRLAGRRAHVDLEKNIPAGGGLGGGSSDAAAILHWAGVTDVALAATLGADVPFCLHGGRADVSGIGDELVGLPYVERKLTLLIPSFAISTADCYRAYDELRAQGAPASGRNHLAPAAVAVEPRLGELMSWWASETGRDVELCGSGSTVFVEGWLNSTPARQQIDSPVGPAVMVEVTSVPQRR
jgi:4-diphosphocytidyl-2-C-methyl-D-erythritol kinase